MQFEYEKTLEHIHGNWQARVKDKDNLKRLRHCYPRAAELYDQPREFKPREKSDLSKKQQRREHRQQRNAAQAKRNQLRDQDRQLQRDQAERDAETAALQEKAERAEIEAAAKKEQEQEKTMARWPRRA